jgi:hypothetical protein
MRLKPLRTAQPVTRGGPPIDGDLYRWLASLMTAAQFAVPPKGVINAYLTAAEVSANFDATGLGNSPGAYEGWAICNGSNDTPNLTDRFVRAKVTGAGATGGADSSAHTHAIDHDHASFTSGSEAAHTHAIDHDHASTASGSPSATVEIASGTGSTVATSTHTHNTDLAQITASSGAGSAHSHSVDVPALTGASGAASATENRPAYYELVPLMRLENA